jgi:hypothetical protein
MAVGLMMMAAKNYAGIFISAESKAALSNGDVIILSKLGGRPLVGGTGVATATYLNRAAPAVAT